MKTLVLSNADNSIRVEYLTDLIGNNEFFTIYKVKGLTDAAIALEMDLGINEYNLNDIKVLAAKYNLTLDVYETGKDVVELVYYGGIIGEI